VISDALAPLLIGLDARNVEALWDRMYSSERLRGYSTGFFTEAIAGVDLALWDLLGKYTGQPVYQLLGGKYRDTIPTYIGLGGATVENLRENAAKALAAGFKTMKMSLSKGAGTRDVDRAAVAADAIRGKGQLLVDSLGGYKLHEAVVVGRELDRMRAIGWWEDALMPEETSASPKLAEALDVAICVGETYSNRFQFRDLVRAARRRDRQSRHLSRRGFPSAAASPCWPTRTASCGRRMSAQGPRSIGAHRFTSRARRRTASSWRAAISWRDRWATPCSAPPSPTPQAPPAPPKPQASEWSSTRRRWRR
jgi:hypothetical protein